MWNKIFMISTCLLLISCSNKAVDNPSEKSSVTENIVKLSDAQMKNVDISFVSLEQKTMPASVKVNGVIDVPPQNLVSISMPLGGYLKSTKLLPGMQVHKGEVIATMEDQQYIQLQQEYLNTKTRLVFAESEFNRQKELNVDKASSDKVFGQATMEYETLRILLKALSEKLQLLGINPVSLTEKSISRTVLLHAPINGFVSKVNVNIGKYVNPTDVLFELVNPEDIHLNVKVFEADFSKIEIGQKVIAYTNTDPGKKYACDIILISKDVLSDRSIEVHCHFDKYDKNLIPGMYMNADIELARTQVNVLPEESVVQFQGKSFVFISSGNQVFEMVEIKTGMSHQGIVEILGAESLLNKVIVGKGAYTLLMALKNKEES